MRKYGKLILIVIISVALFIGVCFLYEALKESYAPDAFPEQSPNIKKKDSRPTVDSSAPDFTVLDENGSEVKLSDFFGKPIVLNFWASWCYYCKEEMPDFNAAYCANPDIQFLMVNVTDGSRETISSAKNFIRNSGYSFPLFFDTELSAAAAYGASGLPMTVFIDKDGNLVTYVSGMLSAQNLNKGIELLKN